MTANELRIGNWYRAKNTKSEHKIASCTGSLDAELRGEPIPLKIGSEKRMEEFGFEKPLANWIKAVTVYQRQCHGQFEVQLTEKGFWVILNWNYSGTRMKLNIGHYEYIHQLQNIYHSIIQEEL